MAERLVIGMSGASGAPLTVALLRQLRETHPEVETHLVVTRGGELTLAQETDIPLDELKGLASVCHENGDIGATIASGSFKTMGMIVVPCSMKTVRASCPATRTICCSLLACPMPPRTAHQAV